MRWRKSTTFPAIIGGKVFVFLKDERPFKTATFAIHAAATEEKEEKVCSFCPCCDSAEKVKKVVFFHFFFESLWQSEALKKHLRVSQCSWLISTLPAPSLPSPPTEKIFHVHALYSLLSESVSAAALQRRSWKELLFKLESPWAFGSRQSDLCLFNALGPSAASPVWVKSKIKWFLLPSIWHGCDRRASSSPSLSALDRDNGAQQQKIT